MRGWRGGVKEGRKEGRRVGGVQLASCEREQADCHRLARWIATLVATMAGQRRFRRPIRPAKL